MLTYISNRRAWRFASGVVGAMALMSNAAGTAQSGWEAVVSSELQRIYQQASNGEPATAAGGTRQAARFDVAGRIQIDVHFDCAGTAPVDPLTSAGLKVSVTVQRAPFCVVEGWALPAALPMLAAVSGVSSVTLPVYALKRPPSGSLTGVARKQRQMIQQASGAPVIDGNAIAIMHADAFASQTGIAGGGVTVGVMSDDVTSLALIQSRGELPAVQVMTIQGQAPLSNPTDEGTMMLEEVHAVAPAAGLAFCGPQTSTEYVSCLGQMAAAGASILVDDLAWGDEDLLSSNSAFVQGVESFLAQYPTALLFTVTENFNGSYWQGAYEPVALSSLGLGFSSATCNGQTDYYVNSFGGADVENLAADETSDYVATFQWADPFGQNASNFDVYWLINATNTVVCVGAAGSSNTFFGPVVPLAAGTYTIVIATPDKSLQGKFLKLWFGGDGLTTLSPSTPGSIISPQAFAPGVLTIGALSAADGIGDTIETFSGQGPIELVFPSPSTIQSPTLVGLDAVYVDAAGTDFTLSPAGLFLGTSAASPNAAAVAALIRSAFPTLTPAQLTSALESGATPLGTNAPNSVYGYGRVDALSALASVPLPTLTGFAGATIVGGTSSPPNAITVTGTGNLTFSVTSTNQALIPAVLASAGAPGVTISPSTCGTSTGACTVSVTPSSGQTGSSSITLTVADAAKRSVSMSAAMTVTSPPAAAMGGGRGGGGSLDVQTLLMLSALLILGTIQRHRRGGLLG
ncbi:MAG: S8 family serine peptidase [Terriglobales bacterium]